MLSKVKRFSISSDLKMLKQLNTPWKPENLNFSTGQHTSNYFITCHVQHSAKFRVGYGSVRRDSYCPGSYNLVGRQNGCENDKSLYACGKFYNTDYKCAGLLFLL